MVILPRPILWTLFIGGVLTSTPGNDGESVLDVALEVGKGFGRQVSSNIRQTTRSTGSTVNKILQAVHSGINLGITETGDNFGRTERFLSQTIPEHTKKIKDSAGDLGNAALDHGTNQLLRLNTIGGVAVKALDDASQTASEEATKYIQGKGALWSTAIQTGGKVAAKANEVTGRAITMAGDIATNPREYAAAGVQRVKSWNPVPASWWPWSSA